MFIGLFVVSCSFTEIDLPGDMYLIVGESKKIEVETDDFLSSKNDYIEWDYYDEELIEINDENIVTAISAKSGMTYTGLVGKSSMQRTTRDSMDIYVGSYRITYINEGMSELSFAHRYYSDKYYSGYHKDRDSSKSNVFVGRTTVYGGTDSEGVGFIEVKDPVTDQVLGNSDYFIVNSGKSYSVRVGQGSTGGVVSFYPIIEE